MPVRLTRSPAGRVADKKATPGKGRTAAPVQGKRSPGRPGAGRRPVATYEAASRHPLIPTVHDVAPSLTIRQQRFLQALARHLYRNDSFIRNLVNVACRIYVGTGPVPVSRFPELDDLWQACANQIDNTGRRSFGAWLRQDVYRNFRIDGEVFVRRRRREEDDPEFGRLTVPVEFEAHTSEFCPHEFTQVDRGIPFVGGVGVVRSKPVAYKFWTSHPGEPSTAPRLTTFWKPEIYHLHDPLTGSTRGEVMLAAALLRALKLATLEDNEMRRKIVSSLLTFFVERPADDLGTVDLDEDEVADMLDAIELVPGGFHTLPTGHKVTSVQPTDEPASFERAVRWQLMAICTCVGIPVNEVTGDDNGVERYGRYLSQRIQSEGLIQHDMMEHQVLNPLRSDWIDAVLGQGLWTPPVDLKPWELYECDWSWPVIPSVRQDQELSSLIGAVKDGVLPHSYVSRTMFGMQPQAVARTAARDAARADALGLKWGDPLWAPDTEVATRIQVAAVAEEMAERDLVDGASAEDSVLDDDVV